MSPKLVKLYACNVINIYTFSKRNITIYNTMFETFYQNIEQDDIENLNVFTSNQTA